jgi:hypothetical protein
MLGLEGSAGAMVVSRDLAAVKKAHTASAVRDYDFAKGQLLSELELLKKELWASWELSRRGKNGAPRPGDPRLAAQLLACLGQEVALLGLVPKNGTDLPTSPPVIGFRIHVPPGFGPTVDGIVAPPAAAGEQRLPCGFKELPPGADPAEYEWVPDEGGKSDGLAKEEEDDSTSGG